MNKALPDQELLKKYLAGKCSLEEVQYVTDWYNSLEENALDAFDADDERRLYRRIKADLPGLERGMSRVWWHTALRIAAVLMAILGLGYLYRSQKTSDATTVMARRASTDRTCLFNKSQQIELHHLPDQTAVWLHPGASLEYEDSFEKQRSVWFSGEAFFEVAHDAARPFEIFSGEVKTKVLGTSFNLRTGKTTKDFEVSVVTGCVEVAAGQKTVKVKRKQHVAFDLRSGALEVDQVKDPKTQKEMWQTASLAFDDQPMEEVARKLSETFQINIQFENPDLKHCRLKVDLTNQRLPEILQMIDTLLGTTYRLEANQLTFVGEGCP